MAPASLGRGLIGGWVYDDTTGQPIQNAIAQLLDAAGQPAPTLPVNSDSLGRFRLSSVSGPGRIRVTKEGYTSADLAVTVVDGRRVEPDDARLNAAQPVDSRGVFRGRRVHQPRRRTSHVRSCKPDPGSRADADRRWRPRSRSPAAPRVGARGSAGYRWWLTAIWWCWCAVGAARDDARQRS